MNCRTSRGNRDVDGTKIKWILKKQDYGYGVNIMHMNGYAPFPDPFECGNAYRVPQTVMNFWTISYVFSHSV
jgi:hypothetical protein